MNHRCYWGGGVFERIKSCVSRICACAALISLTMCCGLPYAGVRSFEPVCESVLCPGCFFLTVADCLPLQALDPLQSLHSSSEWADILKQSAFELCIKEVVDNSLSLES